MTQSNVICASLFSGVFEVLFTHPIDHYKTYLQHKKFTKNKTPPWQWKNIYKGIIPRLYGVVPMRLVFWTSLDSGNRYFDSPIKSAIFASVNQTIIDYPIEYLKIRNMTKNETIKEAIVSFSKHQHNFGVTSTLTRNIGFACIFNYITKKHIKKEDTWERKLGVSALAGFTAATITQPFDYFKTCAQSSSQATWSQSVKNINNISTLFSGLWGRNSVSLISMGIGFTTFELGKCYLSKIF